VGFGVGWGSEVRKGGFERIEGFGFDVELGVEVVELLQKLLVELLESGEFVSGLLFVFAIEQFLNLIKPFYTQLMQHLLNFLQICKIVNFPFLKQVSP
jgi:hypothetical protein